MGSGLEGLVGPEGVAPPLPRLAVGGLGGGGLGRKGTEELGTQRKVWQLLWAVWQGTFRGCRQRSCCWPACVLCQAIPLPDPVLWAGRPGQLLGKSLQQRLRRDGRVSRWGGFLQCSQQKRPGELAHPLLLYWWGRGAPLRRRKVWQEHWGDQRGFGLSC